LRIIWKTIKVSRKGAKSQSIFEKVNHE